MFKEHLLDKKSAVNLSLYYSQWMPAIIHRFIHIYDLDIHLQRVSIKSRIFLNAILRKLYMETSRFTGSQIINILKQVEAAR